MHEPMKAAAAATDDATEARGRGWTRPSLARMAVDSAEGGIGGDLDAGDAMS